MNKDKIKILFENTTEEEVRELDAELPTDTYLVEYERGQDLYIDAVRTHKMSLIFDHYYDKLNAEARQGLISNFRIVSIRFGYGRVKPKLYQG